MAGRHRFSARLAMATYLGTTAYAYDPADRLTSVTPPGGSAIAYTYNATGDELAAGSTTYAYDLADRMTSATVGVTSQAYTWSGDGVRLSAATGAGAATTSFLVDRAAALPQVALERDGTGTVLRDEVYGLGRISVVGASGGIAYEHTDALGSVTDLTGSTGVPLAWSEASPYGAIRSAGAAAGAPADPFGFTGQFQDSPTGLYYLRARQYDPSIGRFLSTDPQPGGMADPYVSAYAYANGNPVRWVDPSGRESQAPQPTPQPGFPPPPPAPPGPSDLDNEVRCYGIHVATGSGSATLAWIELQLIQAPANVLHFSGEVLDPNGLYQLRARSYDPGDRKSVV